METHRKSFSDQPNLYTVIGEIVKLMSCSRVYRGYTIEHLEKLVLPPLVTNRCRLYFDQTDGELIGFISWTFLKPDTEVKYIARKGLIDWDDWNTGDAEGNLWVMDFIAPFGEAKEMCRHTYQDLADRWPGRRLFFRRSAQNDRINSVMLKMAANTVMH